MVTAFRSIIKQGNKIIALVLTLLLSVSPLMAGIRISASDVTSQSFVGVLEVGRAEYSVSDLGTMNAALRNEVQQNLRTYTICPIGSRFRPDFAVSRSDLATSLVAGARVPQYLPGQATYQDVRGDYSRLAHAMAAIETSAIQ